ncbi:MAG: amidohydrolase family protein [Proteobacteria bacterium]|nr:amidohydrolase family protein [Pseudomonadota bacterium]MDA1310421.1 amidohydrolase family protein [Pseudomonadota bacterium]
MGETLFTNVSVIDGTGAKPFDATVRVQGNRIMAVTPGGAVDGAGAEIVDGGGTTLMPGLTDAHAHLSFLDAATLGDINALSAERHILETAKNARKMLDHGFTSMFSGSSARDNLEVALRDAINAGDIPGPRLKAATRQMTVTGGFGDIGREDAYSLVLDGPEAFRKACRAAARAGVDTFKIVPSAMGSGSDPLAEDTAMSDDEVAAVCAVARQRNRMVAAHARSADAVKMCVRNGVQVIYHATLADEEAKDMLEARRDSVFVAPAMGLPYGRLTEGEKYGVSTDDFTRARAEKEIETVSATMADLRKRGIRVLPGGDYGFKWNPHGRNARDLHMFVELFGFTPLEAIQAATQAGGELMGEPGCLGVIAEGAFADLLLVDGDPTKDIAILQDPDRFLAIMKDGAFHKAPPENRAGQQVAAE